MINHEERVQPDVWFHERYAAFAHCLSRYRFACRVLGHRKSVLDLGCGCGYGSAYLAEVLSRRVVGVDIAKEGTGYARRRYPSMQTGFVTASGVALPLKSGSMDAIVAFEMIEHVEDDKTVIHEARRVLKRDGIFIASTPNKLISGMHAHPDNPYHVREYTPDEFVNLLKGTFWQVVLYGHHLTKNSVRMEEVLSDIWRNMALLEEQVHALRCRLATDERYTGLSLLRKVKTWWEGGSRTQFDSPLDRSLFPIRPHMHGLEDWDFNTYAVETAPVLVALCR